MGISARLCGRPVSEGSWRPTLYSIPFKRWVRSGFYGLSVCEGVLVAPRAARFES